MTTEIQTQGTRLARHLSSHQSCDPGDDAPHTCHYPLFGPRLSEAIEATLSPDICDIEIVVTEWPLRDSTDHSMPLDTLLREPGAQEASQEQEPWRARIRGDGCLGWDSALL